MAASGSKADGELLAEYLRSGSANAFTTLVDRHGPMVFATCSRLLGHHDAEDAAQAVFLLLARKAKALSDKADVGPWLHRTAWFVAHTAERERARRSARERETASMRSAKGPAGTEAAAWEDIAPHVDAAIEALPPRYREVVTLCYLEGHTQQEAAAILGKPQGTVASLSSRALEKLRGKLNRRGVAMTGAVLGTALATGRAEAGTLPVGFVPSVQTALGGVSASGTVVTLVQGAAKAMLWAKMKVWTTVAAAATVAACVSAPFIVGGFGSEHRPDVVRKEAPSASPSVLTSADVVGAPKASGPPPRSGTMRGVVLDREGHPVAGAMVFVITPVPGSGRTFSTRRQPLAWRKVQAATTWPPISAEGNMLRAKSAGDGSFIVEAPKPFWQGEVWVYHPDHLPVTIPDSAWQSRGGEVNLGRVALPAGASIRGVVIDENGRPAAGAYVGAQKVIRWRPGVDLGVPQELVVRRSGRGGEAAANEYLLLTPRPHRPGDARARQADADGRYRLSGLEPGLYLVAAWTEVRIGGWPNVESVDEREIEIPGPGANLRRDFELKEGATLSLVVSYAGQAKGHVELRPPRSTAGGWELCQEPVVIAEANADEEGRCTFRGLRAGTYHVTAHVTEFELPPVENTIGMTKHSASGVFKTGEEAKIEIPIKRSVRVTGVVVSVEGGKPVSGFRAQLRSPEDARRGTQRATGLIAVADDGTSQSLEARGPDPVGGADQAALGGFAFDGVQAGRWTLDITASGWFPKRTGIVVPETGHVEPVRVELVPGRAATCGLVLDDATGEPIPEALVLCSEALVLGPSHLGSTRRTVTDAQGRFTLDRLLGKSDDRRFSFKKPGYVRVWFDTDGSAPLPPELDTVRLVRCGSIIGRVLDAAGRPALGYVAQVAKGGFLRRVQADAEGYFRLGELEPGRYAVQGLKETVVVRSGEATEVEIRLLGNTDTGLEDSEF